MWKPFTSAGVPLNLAGPGTISISGKRAAIIICYEQLILWPILASMIEKPSIILAVANNVWVSGTPVPQIEKAAMCSWATLFHLPIIFAANT